MGTRGSNGSGSVTERKLKNGETVYDVYVSYKDRTGKPQRLKRSGFATSKAAEKERRKLTSEIDRGDFVKPSDQRLDAYLESWVSGKRLAEETRNGYETKIRLHIVPHIGHVPLSKVTPDLLNDLYRRLESEGSPGGGGPLSLTTVRHVHNILSGAFKHAVTRSQILPSNPATLADPPTAKQTRVAGFQVWSAAELKRFMECERDSRWFDLWWFMATTGCRRGEALGLHWRDVDTRRGTAHFRPTVGVIRGRIVRKPTTKSGGGHTIDLDPETVRVLEARRAAQKALRATVVDWHDEGLVFARGPKRLGEGQHPGGPLNGNTVSRQFDLAAARALVPDIRLHDLRHTWATLALSNGVNVKVVQERLGHASPQITLSIYSHVIEGMQRDAAKTVASLFAPQTAPQG